ncbi:GNAT family N-acetyltransferase [Marinomonas transparens]|uniref:GNAT family N-acetyltransferase n=1 Tax=Marinomonas transparens TaxID=2795388 RepID=A0A934JHV8_9GAMM|nr:GNAT family N-acetyltransferase [Marinomonas transparens]MBJ7536056.1 GNAT family N-acetyltransferase [Marinomonas transparens]
MKQIKEVFADQAEVLAHLIRQANRPVATRFKINQDNCPKHPSFCKSEWIQADFDRGERYFLLTENSQPIACVAYEVPVRENAIKKAYLNRLSVLPDQQNKGTGSKLVEHVIQQALSDQLDLISIGIIAQHTQLQDWYEKIGFITGDTKGFEHLPFDVTYMTYKLND